MDLSIKKRIMKHLLAIIVLILWPIYMMGDNASLYLSLDSALAHRQQYVEQKERNLREMKQGARYVSKNEDKLRLYYQLATGYQAYLYDSAMTYVNKGLILSRHLKQSGNINENRQEMVQANLYEQKNLMLKANLLISRGFYAEAKDLLMSLETAINANATDRHSTHEDTTLAFSCYSTLYILYNNWSAYCDNNEYGKAYFKLKLSYLKKALAISPQKDAFYYYLMGENGYFNHLDQTKTLSYYQKVMQLTQPANRLYAQAAFATAELYKQQNKDELYEQYLILAAIADVKSATKENLALQDLAFYLYQGKKPNIKKAQEYISISLEDAYAYNNPLRRMAISSKLQLINDAYAKSIKARNLLLSVALIAILLLLIGVFISSYFIRKKNNLLRQKQKEISGSAEQLNLLNHQLNQANEALRSTNKKREVLVKVYIDLCYKYIDRLSRFRTLVKRKLVAKQSQELLSTLSSSRTSDKEDKDFLQQFDQAFLSLYPTFVEELNALLQPSAQIQLKESHEMPPVLRVFALIRLGITESSKIAGILSYSPQTVYNYRSTLKNNALDKEHFEENIHSLCNISPDNLAHSKISSNFANKK